MSKAVDAACHLHHFRHPVAADVGRVQPLQRHDPRPAVWSRRRPYALDPLRQPALEPQCALARPAGLAEANDVREDIVEACRIEGEDVGFTRQARGDAADLVVGDGANGAHGLRHDQVRPQALEEAHTYGAHWVTLLGLQEPKPSQDWPLCTPALQVFVPHEAPEG